MTDEARTETCPRCGAAKAGIFASTTTYECGASDGPGGYVRESISCTRRQLAALRERVADLEQQARDLAVSVARMGAARDAAESRAHAYASEILTALSGVVSTPAAGYEVDGGPGLARSDLSRMRCLFEEIDEAGVSLFRRAEALAEALRRARLRLLDETFVSASPTIRKRLTDLAETIEQDLSTAPQPAATGRGGDRG